MTGPFERHVFVCTQQKPDVTEACGNGGGEELLMAFRREVGQAGLGAKVGVTGCGCLGLCSRGPVAVVYPEGTFYTGLRPADVGPLVAEHMVAGRPLTRGQDPSADTLHREMVEAKGKFQAMMAAKERSGQIPDRLSQLLRAFMTSRPLLTAIELDLFTHVGEGGTAQDIADRMGLKARGVAILLDAVVALGALDKAEGRYTKNEWARNYLSQGSPHDSRLALKHTVNLWKRWSTMTECIRAGEPVRFDEMTDRGPEWTEAFISAMDKNAMFRASAVAGALDLEGVERLLDLGGGSGAYSIAFVRARPGLVATVLDLPTVIPLTEGYAKEAGVADRIRTQPGDMRTDSYGEEEYDLAWISAICHMLSPEQNKDMLTKAHKALRPGGRVIIQDFILDGSRTSPLTGALFALNMLVSTEGGNSYSEDEYATWLRETGFARVCRMGLAGPTDLMVGVKAG